MTVAVVAYEAGDRIDACLDSLHGHDVWVVDNGGTRVSRDDVRVIAPPENVGYGRAVNLVAEQTDGEWIAAANDDIQVEPGAIDALLAAAQPDDGALAPRLILPDGTTQQSMFPFPSPRAFLRGSGTDWALGAFLLLRREAFEQAGGFDEQQFMYAEDLSLGWRLHTAGWNTRYVPEARVQHTGGAATAEAYGPDRTEREFAAAYAWMRAERGHARTWVTAGVGWATCGSRYWRRIHRHGLPL